MDNFCIFLRQKGSLLLCLSNHCEQFLFRVIFEALHIKPNLPFPVPSQSTPQQEVCVSDPRSFSLFPEKALSLRSSILPFFRVCSFVLLPSYSPPVMPGEIQLNTQEAAVTLSPATWVRWEG